LTDKVARLSSAKYKASCYRRWCGLSFTVYTWRWI